ncbi:MAG: hypothetical protein JNJ54_01790 [Myxococcaceae bacterium]|nr:hypothetical protein [Myxococcaceae bacterium]
MVRLVVMLSLSVLAAACSPAICTTGVCICPEGQTCGFDTCSASTSNCSYSCNKDATCTGSCGANCTISCDGKSCTHTVGANSTVSCAAGGTCNITCEGKCTTGSSGTLNLTCKVGTKSDTGCN